MKFPEKWRQSPPGFESKEGDDYGYFLIPSVKQADGNPTRPMKVIASAGVEEVPWQHVSVSLYGNSRGCPSWKEMSFIKSVFWDAEECVMQLHPPESEYVNDHPGCLHLWRPTEAEIPRPPIFAV